MMNPCGISFLTEPGVLRDPRLGRLEHAPCQIKPEIGVDRSGQKSNHLGQCNPSFFLAYARKEKDMQLEKLLFWIFMVLPPEASNQKTHFMERRLWTSSYHHLKLNSFGYRQGMLQVHADFCRNFFQGCADCELLELLQAQAG